MDLISQSDIVSETEHRRNVWLQHIYRMKANKALQQTVGHRPLRLREAGSTCRGFRDMQL